MFSRYPRVMRPLGQWAEVLDLLAAFTCAALIAAIALDRVGPARIMLALVFTFFVPGRAIVANWPRMARWSEAAMPMVISLAVTGLVATVALWAHLWYPIPIFQVEAWLSLAGLIIAIVRRRRLGLFGPSEDEQGQPVSGIPRR
jgi:peptidoglycan/LPS O-acetylase OafA/YrhL